MPNVPDGDLAGLYDRCWPGVNISEAQKVERMQRKENQRLRARDHVTKKYVTVPDMPFLHKDEGGDR